MDCLSICFSMLLVSSQQQISENKLNDNCESLVQHFSASCIPVMLVFQYLILLRLSRDASPQMPVSGCTYSTLSQSPQVVDTPDFINFNPKPTEPEARQQVLQWKSLTQPAPDVILLVVRCDVRYTKEEHDIYKEIKNLWGDDEQFCERLAVAFTFGDMQDKDLKEVLKTVCQELRSVLDDAGDRFFQINNKATGDEKQTQQMQMHQWLDSVVSGGRMGSIHTHTHTHTHISIYVSMCLCIYLSIYLSIYLFISLSIYLSVCLSVCLSVLSVCVCVCVCDHQFV